MSTEKMEPVAAIDNIKAALEAGPSDGPWQVLTSHHPFETASGGGQHIERRIFTTWDHPQMKGPIGVVNGVVGLGVGARVHFVGIDEADAAYIAACNPSAIRELLAYVESLERERAEDQGVIAVWRRRTQEAEAKVESLEKDAGRWRTFIGLKYEVRADWAANLSLVPVLTQWVDSAAKEQTK